MAILLGACGYVAGAYFSRHEKGSIEIANANVNRTAETAILARSAAPARPFPQSCPPVPETRECNETSLRRRIEILENKLEEKSQAATTAAERVAFPEDAPAQAKPEGFRGIVEKVIRDCNPGLEISDVDCSEYPCIAWTKWHTDRTSRFDLSSCKPWTDAYSRPPIVLTATTDPDGGPAERYLAFFSLPDDASTQKLVKARARARLDEMLEAYGLGAK